MDRGLVPRSSIERTQNDAAVEDNLVAFPGDIVYNMMRMWQGALGIAYQVCLISPAYVVLEPKKETNPEFYARLLKTAKYLHRLESYSYGLTSDRLRLYFKDLSLIALPKPQLDEQTKISSFLDTIDTQIEQLTKKKKLLEQYKKAVMQQIFKQQLRFKDDNGGEFSNWKEKKLGEVCKIDKGEQLNKEFLTELDIYPCINGGITPSGFTNKFNQVENTITISEGGNSCGFVNFMTSKFWCGGHCYTVEVSNNSLNDKLYIYNLLKFYESDIMRLRVGSGLPNIQKKDLLRYRLIIADSLPEQQKIATFLSVIDERIKAVQTQIDLTKTYKKGLLKQLFI